MKNQTASQLNVVFTMPCLPAHVSAILNDVDSYHAHLKFLIESKTFSAMPGSIRSTVLVALHATSQHKVLALVVAHSDITDISSALTRLDQQRTARQLARKIAHIENTHPHVILLPEEQVNPSYEKRRKSRRKVDSYRNKLRAIEAEAKVCNCTNCESTAHNDSAAMETIQSAPGVSGALARKVRQWIRSVRSDALEFVMLTMPHKTPWKKMADLVHPSPSDFSVDYFLADVYDEPIPQNCFVAQMRAFVAENSDGQEKQVIARNFQGLSNEFPQVYLAYPYLRTLEFLKTAAVYKNLAQKVPLDVVLWNFEDFYRLSPECSQIVRARLRRNELGRSTVNTKVRTFGKLMERILTFRRLGLRQLADDLVDIAEDRLQELKSYWTERVQNKKVAVIGDASASMQSAVEAASIFASLVSVCFDGTLGFYSSKAVPSPHLKPQNALQALDVCTKVRANNCTSPAAALWDFVEKQQWLDLLVHVTDEFENVKCNGKSHAQLLAEYKESVNPHLRVVIVTVGAGCKQFRSEMTKLGVDFKVVTIDGLRPDLAKFDTLLGNLVAGLKEDKVVDRQESEVEEEFVVV